MHALHCIITSLIYNDLGTLVQGVSVTTGAACIFIFVVLFTVAIVASIIFLICRTVIS